MLFSHNSEKEEQMTPHSLNLSLPYQCLVDRAKWLPQTTES